MNPRPTRRAVLHSIAAAPLLGVPLISRAAEQGVKANAIRLGQTAALTGALAGANIQAKLASDAVFRELNDKGGVFGRKIEVLSADDGSDPKRAVENFKAMQNSEGGIFSAFALGGTPTNMALFPLLEEQRIPSVAPLTGLDFFHNPQYRMTFHIRAPYSIELDKIAAYCAVSGLKDVCVLLSDNAFGKGALALFESAAAAHKLNIKARVSIGDKLDNGGAITQQLIDSKAQAVIGLVASQAAFGWAKAELPKLQRAQLQYLTISLLSNEGMIKALDGAATGIIVAQAMPHPQSRKYPVASAYVALMKRAGISSIGFSGMEGYVAARIVVEALTRAGRNLTREGFIAALSARPFDLKGFTVSFTGGKRTGSSFVELSKVGADGRFIM